MLPHWSAELGFGNFPNNKNDPTIRSPVKVSAYSAASAGAPLKPTTIERRDLRPHDILIDIKFSGVCHTDIHQAREEWGQAIFPMVPGHEIAGVVT